MTSTSYTPGSFLAAYRAESAHQNERSEIGWPTATAHRGLPPAGRGPRRRIVTRTAAGAQLAAGERMG